MKEYVSTVITPKIDGQKRPVTAFKKGKVNTFSPKGILREIATYVFKPFHIKNYVWLDVLVRGTSRSDLDNILKALQDALQDAKTIENDKQITKVTISYDFEVLPELEPKSKITINVDKEK